MHESEKSKNAIGNAADAIEASLYPDKVGGIWKSDPLPWQEFFAHPDHMSFPPLSQKQIEFCSAGLAIDPKKTFDPAFRQYDTLTAVCGKGSGKDALACMIVCHLVQVLLRLKNPFGTVYGADIQGEPIDILIVAPRGRTSEKVTFEKLKQRVLHWKWLRQNYRIRHSGREITGADREFEEDAVEIGSNSIIFPGNIRVFALNSSQESAEGFNTLAFICTEFAAFVNSDDRPNADRMFSTLYTSANTRFPGKFLGMLISYPRYKGDAIMQKYDEAKVNKKIFAMKATSWEFNPMLKRENYEAELNSDNPEKARDARTKYLCEPEERESRFIGLPDRISACVSGRKQIAEFEPVEELVNGMRMLRMKLTKLNISRQPDSRKYVARVDLGKSHDRAALCIGHREGDRVIIDLLVHWVPDEKTKLVVDVDNPADVILELRKVLININYVTYDQWNSASSINRLNRKNIVTNILSLRGKEYQLFLHSLYSRNVDLLNFHALTDKDKGELFHLTIDRETGKVDHEEGWHNDLTESVCGVVAMLRGTNKNVNDIESGMANIHSTTHNVSNYLWADSEENGPFGADDDDSIFPGDGISLHR